MIDRMLGGFGKPLDRVREFSEIEMTIIERMFVNCMNLLREPWKNVVKVEPHLERIETNTQFAQLMSPSDSIALVTIRLTIGEVDGLINICLPFITMEPIIDKLNTRFWFSTLTEKNVENEQALERMLEKTAIPVVTYLGRSTISVNDFVNLQKGDIIKLDTKIDDELNVYVGRFKKFKALPGTKLDKYAVRVTSINREE
jgi:flagellar motor switch protein FliM